MRENDDLLGSPIAFHRMFARIAGSITAGLLLSQLWYWKDKGHNAEGWIYKTQAELEEETCLTRSEQETARRALRERGFIEEIKRGIPARLFYRVDREAVWCAINKQGCGNPANKDAETPQASMTDSRRQERWNPANKDETPLQSIKGTENTAEITSEITQETTNKDAPTAQGVLVSPAMRSKQLSVSSRTQIQERFEAFWKAYPNRVAKQAAWVAWQKIKPDAETLEAILEAIPKQSSYRAACESRRLFCPSWPHPATWLNGQRWQDACELPTGGQIISHTGGMDVVYKETLARVEAFDDKYGIQRD